MMNTKPIELAMPSQGMDMVTPDTSLPRGAVRSAWNVVLQPNGNFSRRPGEVALVALPDAHSLWYGAASGRALVAAGDALYQFDPVNPSVAAVFTGLPVGQPVEYCEHRKDVYFCAPGVLGKITADGRVRRPGVAELVGYKPLLSATVGGLLPGRYGVAYSLVNDLGEESGLSGIEWINLPNGGGIMLDGLVQASNAGTINIYCTAPNSGELYLNQSSPWAAALSIRNDVLGKLATKRHLSPMPGGSIVRYWRGRLYVVSGTFVYYSQPFDLGVYDVKSGWLAFGKNVTMFEPVEGGIYVGFKDEVLFLRGTDPDQLAVEQVMTVGAVAHSGVTAPGHYFASPVTQADPDRQVAAWLSDVGVVLGLPGGKAVPLQAARLRLSVEGPSRAAVILQGGIKQGIFLVESTGTAVPGDLMSV